VKFPTKQSGNVFEHLGKSVKFVTHCGDREGMLPIFKASSLEEYEQRALMEHTTYQVLDRLALPSLKTRVVRLTYHDTHSDQEETRVAFVREPEDEMAERCGMIEAEDLPDAGSTEPLRFNAHSQLLTHLLNGFVIQSDWVPGGRNTLALIDLARSEIFWAPYDFDFVGIFRPDYPRNENRNLAENAARFAEWLRLNQSPTLFMEVDHFVSRGDAMREAIDQPGMSDRSVALFSDWLATYGRVLREFSACRGHAEDPSRPSCFVPDDHGNSVETATLKELGSWQTLIEPALDVDVFSVLVQASTLYSFGGNAQLEFMSPNGDVLVSTGGPQSSVRAPWAGAAYVRASLGGSLVAAQLGQLSHSQRARDIYVYADDHGASSSTATLVQPGDVVSGYWELDGRFGDEDWFLVQAGPTNSLTVTLDGAVSSGGVEVVHLATGGDGSIAWLQPGVNEIESLFSEPGDYIVKVMQDYSMPPTTYTIELR
jgi:hypothetical protein